MKTSEEFYLGAICALAAMATFGEDTIYDEIVKTFDEDELIRVARKTGNMRWSGLDQYRKRKRST